MKKIISIILYKLKFKCGVTHNIHGDVSYGYGKVDEFGFWQFPLEEKLNRRINQK